MRKLAKPFGIMAVYAVGVAFILNLLYALEPFRSCITVSPECSGSFCELMDVAMECTPSVWWYAVMGLLLVLPAVIWQVALVTRKR
jgi:hypothetical protein